MTRAEQQRMIDDLREYVPKMDRTDREEFEMFLKRHRDDEELDALSVRRLEELHRRYVVRKTRKDIQELLKKYSAQQRRGNGTI